MSIAKKIVSLSGAAVALGFAALPFGGAFATDDSKELVVNAVVEPIFKLEIDSSSVNRAELAPTDQTETPSQLFSKINVSTNAAYSGYSLYIKSDPDDNTGCTVSTALCSAHGDMISATSGAVSSDSNPGWNYSVYSDANSQNNIAANVNKAITTSNVEIRNRSYTGTAPLSSDPTWVRYNVATSGANAGTYVNTVTYTATALAPAS